MTKQTTLASKWSKGWSKRACWQSIVMRNLPSPTKKNKSNFQPPAYLYQKGNIYYFRYVFPKLLQQSLGGTEIRLSLRTPYLRLARVKAQQLYNALSLLLQRENMLSLSEIKKRLTALLLEGVEQQSQKLESFKNSDIGRQIYEALGIDDEPPLLDAEYHHNYFKRLYTEKRFQEFFVDNWIAEKLYSGISEILTEKELDAIHTIPFSTELFFSLFAEASKEHLLKNKLFTEKEFTENRCTIAKTLLQFIILFSDYVVKEEAGDILGAQNILHEFLTTMDTTAKQASSPLQEISPQQVLKYSEAVERFALSKIMSKHWKVQTLDDHKNRLNYFLYIIGDKPIEAVTREDMHTFLGKLQQLPPNRTKLAEYTGKTVDEVIAMQPNKKLNVKTINTITAEICSLFEWCVHEGILTQNPAKKLLLKDTRNAIDLREIFTRAELEKIFNHPKFVEGQFKYPAYYWIPLISLFTGMRLEEIAQLHCADIKKLKAELWVIDINEEGEDENGFLKTLKNKNARRQVPIHKALIDLGFIDYVTGVSQANHIRVFPELNQTTNTPKLGKQPGKQFSAVVKESIKNSDKKSFHSLRHTFADFYKQRGLQTDMFRQLYGHEIPHLASRQYGSKFPAELLYTEVISKLDYELDLSTLLNSRFRVYSL